MTPTAETPFEDLPRDSDGLATTEEALSILRERLPAFLDELAAGAGADRLVVWLDGSVETALAATLAVEAVGADRVTGLVLPAFLSDEAMARNAEAVATALGIEYARLQLQPVLTAFQEAVAATDGATDDLIATNNLLSRLRMTAAYYVANTTNALVVGTITRTDYLLGSVTKHGETGADCFLLGGLYRTEVDALARSVGVPTDLTDGSPLNSVTRDRSGSADLEISEDTIDRILRLHVDTDLEAAIVADRLDVDVSTVERLAEWHAETEHKRFQPVERP